MGSLYLFLLSDSPEGVTDSIPLLAYGVCSKSLARGSTGAKS